jgi:DNA-directed RNA polymerase specialized sigma24 family protein
LYVCLLPPLIRTLLSMNGTTFGPTRTLSDLTPTAAQRTFWDLHAALGPMLFQKAYRICVGREDDAIAMLRQTLTQVHREWNTFGHLTELKQIAWVMRMLIRRAAPLWHGLDHSPSPGNDAGVEPASSRAFQTVGTRESKLQEVYLAIIRLPGRQREVMELYGISGFDLPLVAKMLDITVGAARVHIYLALRRLGA